MTPATAFPRPILQQLVQGLRDTWVQQPTLPNLIIDSKYSAYLQDQWLFSNGVHELPPGGVHSLECGTLSGNLLHDLLRPKDGLQVQPLALYARHGAGLR